MSLKCFQVLRFLEEKYPLSLSEEYDNVGLLLGNHNKEINSILVCLEVTDSVVTEAINLKADMILSHHPLIFKPLKRITDRDLNSSVITNIIKNDINLYCMHTNFDNSPNGMNDILARSLNLNNIRNLSSNKKLKLYKIAVFAPTDQAEKVRNAMFEAGAGHIGNYSKCSFSTMGTGSFKPLEGTSPFIGEIGNLELVEESKVETIVDSIKIRKVIAAMLKAHPYEEVAYDIYELSNSQDLGTGRVGELEKPMLFNELCKFVKEKLNITDLRVSGNMNKVISKIAVVGGAGESFIEDSINAGCDVLITGDIKHHAASDAASRNLNIIDAGHYNTEIIFVSFIADFINKNLGIECLKSKIITNPFQTV